MTHRDIDQAAIFRRRSTPKLKARDKYTRVSGSIYSWKYVSEIRPVSFKFIFSGRENICLPYLTPSCR
jgi:hypothetical protein